MSSRRRLNLKPNRFSRNSKRRGVLKRLKLRGGSKEEELNKLVDFAKRVAELRTNSRTLKEEIADQYKKGVSANVIKGKYEEYTTALNKLIDDIVSAAIQEFPDDKEIGELRDKVAELKKIVNDYYDLRDIYDMISEFFVNRIRSHM